MDKDFTNFKLNEKVMENIKALYAEGASTAQHAFQRQVAYILDELEAHRDGTNPAPRGLLAAIKDKMTIAGLNEKGVLSKSYFTPSFAIASTIHYGKASDTLRFIWENDEGEEFLRVGDDIEGSKVRGPLYTPSRLNACWGKLNDNEAGIFAHDMEGVYATKDDKVLRWETLTVKELGAINRGEKETPEATDLLTKVIGTPGKYDKRGGSIAKLIGDLRQENEKVGSDMVSDLADKLEGVLVDLRDDMGVIMAKAHAEEAAAAAIEAEQKRLERRKNSPKGDAPIANREENHGEAVTLPDTDEVDEHIDAEEAETVEG